MARVPRITSPCPFRWQSAPQPGKDFCGQCSRRVHNLDSMTQTERETFLAACTGKVCVAYTIRPARRNSSSIGVGLAASVLVAGAAFADEIPTNGDPAPGEYCDPLREELIIVGGTNAGKELQWVDASEAAIVNPELPEIDVSEWLPTPADDVPEQQE